MPEVNSAREEILARLRSASGQSYSEEQRMQEWNAIRRAFRKTGSLNREERLRLFEERLRDYGTGVHYSSEKNLQAIITEVLQARQKKRIAAPADFPRDWLPLTVEVVDDTQLSYAALDQIDGVLTACTLAIALTGTIVLQSGPCEGRRALTLIPDYHLCIVREEQVVELVPEAIEKLHSACSRPLTFISGPSATADIEMMRVQGVHGPRVMDVIIVR